jgi:hypothetical protein
VEKHEQSCVTEGEQKSKKEIIDHEVRKAFNVFSSMLWCPLRVQTMFGSFVLPFSLYGVHV